MSIRAGVCRHYNGSSINQTCGAGVDYRSVTPSPDLPGSAYRLPCKAMSDASAHAREVLARYGPAGTCDKCSLLTEEEAQELEKQSDRDMAVFIAMMKRHENFFTALRKKYRESGWAGMVVCPECGANTMRVSVDRCNGHMRVSCPTGGCLRWME